MCDLPNSQVRPFQGQSVRGLLMDSARRNMEEQKSASWRSWFRGAKFAIYSCHFLASWSGRMWAFAMGLFLISISPDSLQLSATYGLTLGACVLLLGTLIGHWVDKTPRIKAAIRSMILQNVFVVVCACVVLTLLVLLSEIQDLSMGLQKFFYALIISLSVISRLLKVARIIVVERDWIIEISRQNNADLSVMTSSFRRIDLLTKILAPIFTGQIMTYAGLKISCGVISLWSMVSMYAEYRLIGRVYTIVPALHAVKDNTRVIESKVYMVDPSTNKSDDYPEVIHLRNAEEKILEKSDGKSVTKRRSKSFSPIRFLDSFVILFRGFRTYTSYKVKWAGMALASLYLTVLGFDGITVGYATTQGMSGSILGIMMGTGAVFGIIATFTYPHIVKRLGLAKTGVLALSLQLSCLSLCVISVWLPGSPFDPTNQKQRFSSFGNASRENCSLGIESSLSNTTTGVVFGTSESNPPNVTDTIIGSNASSCSPCLDESTVTEPKGSKSMISVWVMLAGIVTARFGLWTADLAIIQLFLERVAPSERGIVNGFQSSLNQLMDFCKYAFVVAIPLPHQFGLLVFISYFFISTGWTMMMIFAIRTRRKAL